MSKQDTTKLDPIRKAAILISTLDHRVADALLERMSESQAILVRSVAMELDEIPDEERQRVLREFLRGGDPLTADDDAVELDQELARKLAEGEAFAQRADATSDGEEPPFRFLCDAETEAIARHLEHENPQIIAVVLAHLPPRQAADLLDRFEPRLQATLLRRIAELDTADRDVVRDVEKHLRMLLLDELRAAKNREIGLSTVASILTAAGEARRHLISSLNQHDRQLAHQLRQPLRPSSSTAERSAARAYVPPKHEELDEPAEMPEIVPMAAVQHRVQLQDAPAGERLSFEELAQFGDADLAVVFRESDSKLALLALAGAAPKFVERLLKNLPSREAKSLRRTMERLGPLQLSDIEQAQQAIAEIADGLVEDGVIDRPHPKPFAVAA